MTIEPFYFIYFLSISLASSATGLLYPVKVFLLVLVLVDMLVLVLCSCLCTVHHWFALSRFGTTCPCPYARSSAKNKAQLVKYFDLKSIHL